MTKQPSHIINKVFIEVNTNSLSKGNNFKDNFLSYLKENLFPLLEDKFNHIANKNTNSSIRFEELIIDVDASADSNFSNIGHDIVSSIEKQVVQSLESYLLGNTNQQNLLVNESNNQKELVHKFLKEGELPWWFLHQNKEDVLDEEILQYVVITNLKNRTYKERFIKQFSDTQIADFILKKVKDRNQEEIKRQLSNIVVQLQKNKAITLEKRFLIWDIIITELIIKEDKPILKNKLALLLYAFLKEEMQLQEQVLLSIVNHELKKQTVTQLISDLTVTVAEVKKSLSKKNIVSKNNIIHNINSVLADLQNLQHVDVYTELSEQITYEIQECTKKIILLYDKYTNVKSSNIIGNTLHIFNKKNNLQVEDVSFLLEVIAKNIHNDAVAATFISEFQELVKNVQYIKKDQKELEKEQNRNKLIQFQEKKENTLSENIKSEDQVILVDIIQQITELVTQITVVKNDSTIGEQVHFKKVKNLIHHVEQIINQTQKYIDNEAYNDFEKSKKNELAFLLKSLETTSKTITLKSYKLSTVIKVSKQIQQIKKVLRQIISNKSIVKKIEQHKVVKQQEEKHYKNEVGEVRKHIKQNYEEFIESYKVEASKIIETDVELYINNAGLVLVHPFLKHFFTNLNLFDNQENKIINAEKSVHLLHYMATKKSNAYESNMTFEKILCGIPQNKPINRFIELTTVEKEETEIMLQSVLANWEKMTNSSVDLLRNEFLQRRGKLTIKNRKIRIKIEQKPQDILLNKLNWTLSLIKIPWLDSMIYVEW